MMGAVLQMVNWRLSAEQILYTLNHAEAKMIIINSDFLPILVNIREKLENIKTIVVIAEDGIVPETPLNLDAVYEEMLANATPAYDFPDLDENTKATTFYTTGTTGDPKGVHFTHRQLVLHTLSTAIALGSYDTHRPIPIRGRVHAHHPHVPRPRLGPPLRSHPAGGETDLSGKIRT